MEQGSRASSLSVALDAQNGESEASVHAWLACANGGDVSSVQLNYDLQ